jgi:hypothetical protein
MATKTYVKWGPIIDVVRSELQAYRDQGFGPPSIRSMFYRLASKNIISNTKAGYTGLINATTKARWKGELDMDCFSDETRRIIQDFDITFFTPNDLINHYLGQINNMSQDFINTVPRWYMQPHYVELWTEKKAMINNLVPILADRQVTIVPTSGFNSLPFLYASYNRLVDQYRNHVKEVHIVYYGDFDPSGEGIDADITNRLQKMIDKDGKEITISFERIAVKPDQITQYDLPIAFDAKTRKKLEKDPRRMAFEEKHGDLYQVELDALPALIPDEFRRMILDSVDQYFDERIYQEMLKEISETYSPTKIDEIVKNLIRSEAKRFSDNDESQ